MQLAKPKARRWSYAEYSRLTDLGFFDRQRVELIGGRIIQRVAQRDVHTAGVSLARDAVAAAFGPGYWVRVQAPLHMGRWSGPEPDVSVVPGSARDYVGTGHPKSALLVVEVSDTTLRFDRRVKQGMYAKYDIQHYWIVNPVDLHVEVYGDPVPDSNHPFGYRYSDVKIFLRGQSITPLATAAAVKVDDLLP